MSWYNLYCQSVQYTVITQGAVVGVLVALPLSLWIGLGAIIYHPPLPAPARSLSGCPSGNVTDNHANITLYRENTTWLDDSVTDVPDYTTSGVRVPKSKLWSSSPDYKE